MKACIVIDISPPVTYLGKILLPADKHKNFLEDDSIIL